MVRPRALVFWGYRQTELLHFTELRCIRRSSPRGKAEPFLLEALFRRIKMKNKIAQKCVQWV